MNFTIKNWQWESKALNRWSPCCALLPVKLPDQGIDMKTRIVGAVFTGLLLAGCNSTRTEQRQVSPEQRAAQNEEISTALRDVSEGRSSQLPPYPGKAEIPKQGAGCDALVSKKREMGISAAAIQVLQVTKQKPWGIFLFDVDASGRTSNVRAVKTAGMKSVDMDFKQSIESWQFAPGAGAKGCVAEMKIT